MPNDPVVVPCVCYWSTVYISDSPGLGQAVRDKLRTEDVRLSLSLRMVV